MGVTCQNVHILEAVLEKRVSRNEACHPGTDYCDGTLPRINVVSLLV